MDAILELLWTLILQLPSFFMNPMLYVFVLLIFFLYKRVVHMERKFFHVKMVSAWEHTIQSIFYGLLGGLAASLLVAVIGIVLQPQDFWLLWAVALVLSLFHVRYLCFAYAGGLIGVMSLIARYWPQGEQIAWLSWIWGSLQSVNIPGLLALVAIFHLVEGILVRLHAAHGASPIFLQNSRGRLIGGYQIQKFWLMPVVILVPGLEGAGEVAGAGIAMAPSWWPLLGGGISALMMLPVPVITGYADLAVARTPKEKALLSFRLLMLYSLILLGLSIAGSYWMPVLWAAAIFSFLGHDGMIWFSRWREWLSAPLFVNGDKGVRILAVIPGSAAEKMKIEPGDVIVKINGVPIASKEDIYPAIRLHPAFCKMEAINAEGHTKFLQTAHYQGEHHQLGIIVAPDERADYYLKMKSGGIWGLARQLRRNSSGKVEEEVFSAEQVADH